MAPSNKRKRLRLLMNYPYCAYCGVKLSQRNSTVDHVVPKCRGGSNSLSNLVLSCEKCNADKGDKMASAMTVKLMDKRYQLVFQPPPVDHNDASVVGYCEPPDTPHKRIVVDGSLTGRDRLEVILHELLHGAHWQIDEDVIEIAAHAYAVILWDRLGYRD